MDAFLSYISTAAFVGEVGLDYSFGDAENHRRQRQVFAQILASCAGDAGKVLTVHSRRALDDVISMVAEALPGTVIMHWFSGNFRQLERAAEEGSYFSVNPAMIRSKRGRDLVARMDPTRVLTETDGPFIKFGDHPAMPWDVRVVVQHLASVWQCTRDEAEEHVYANYLSAVSRT